MHFSDLPEDILLKIATCIDREWSNGNTWGSFAVLDSRCRAAALTARLAIAQRYFLIKDREDSTVQSLYPKELTAPLLTAIRKIHLHVGALGPMNVRSSNAVELQDAANATLTHLYIFLIFCQRSHTLKLTGESYSRPGPFPMQIVLWMLTYMHEFPKKAGIVSPPIRVLILDEVSWYTSFRYPKHDVISGLETLHIKWTSSSRKSPQSSPTACREMARFIKTSRHTLQSLKLDFSGNLAAKEGFDIRMLGDEGVGNEDSDEDEQVDGSEKKNGDGNEDENEDEGEGDGRDDNKVQSQDQVEDKGKDEQAWKKLRKLKLTIDVDKQSPMGNDIVGTLDAIATTFPNLERLNLILEPNRYYHDMVRYTPGILKPLSKLKNLRYLFLALDLECESNDELEEDHDHVWYNRCLHRRYAATQDIANVCLNLTHCYWKQHIIDSEGNNGWQFFRLENEDSTDANGQKIQKRVVKTKQRWWMAEEWVERVKSEQGVDLQFPGEVILGKVDQYGYLHEVYSCGEDDSDESS
ncbi:hypothetical protein D9758_005485 [Tetrapyrgos nigripes]|uniref:Uncharacterized protein n=1 Tax=Tetrapyrgos nigripes TaxID=182062 RepID=A0A8H5GIA1_9AGAR|nr:hypothetical protein D9758_005485 [Tetrapyrgos nigripes]